MIYLNRLCPIAVIDAALAVSLPVLSKAEDPIETIIHGTIPVLNAGNQAAQASLAKLSVQQAIDAAVHRQSRTVLRVELQMKTVSLL